MQGVRRRSAGEHRPPDNRMPSKGSPANLHLRSARPDPPGGLRRPAGGGDVPEASGASMTPPMWTQRPKPEVEEEAEEEDCRLLTADFRLAFSR